MSFDLFCFVVTSLSFSPSIFHSSHLFSPSRYFFLFFFVISGFPSPVEIFQDWFFPGQGMANCLMCRKTPSLSLRCFHQRSEWHCPIAKDIRA